MFNDTIVLDNGLAANITFVRRNPRGTRQVFVPSGDTPSDEKRIEIGHEVTSAKRVNTLVKFGWVKANPVTNVLEEASIQIKIVHPASTTLEDVQMLSHFASNFISDNSTVAKLFNQEV